MLYKLYIDHCNITGQANEYVIQKNDFRGQISKTVIYHLQV